MNKNNLKELSQSLSSNNILDDSGLDITWNYFNLLASSKEMILFLLTKTNMIPMIDYFAQISAENPKKVYEDFGLNLQQATTIQNFNIELLNIQRVIQIYCSQMFNLSSYSSTILYELIDNIPEETNVENIEVFMKTLNLFKSGQQKGGNKNDTIKMFIKLLLLLLIITPSIKTSNELQKNLELVTKKDDAYNPYNAAIISGKKDDEFLKAIKSLEYKKSSVDISKVITVYDKNIKSKYDTLFGSLINLLQPTMDAKQTILNIVNNFNTQSKNSSIDIQKNCIELMKNSYEHGIFSTWKSLDDIEITKQKIDTAKKLVEEENNKSKEKIGATTFAAVASLTTGDVFSAAAYLSAAGETFFDSLSSTKKLKEEEKQIISVETENTRGLSIQEKRNLENKLYTYSKLYCSYGYNLQLSFDETTNVINIYGDKIDYNWMKNLIDVLQENLKLSISNAEKDTNRQVEYLLKSTLQRLEILNEITNELSNIINFSFETHIMNLQIQPSANTINEIQNYFDDQMNKLKDLTNKLNEMYPKDKDVLLKEQKIAEADIELNVMKQNLLDLQSNATNIIKQKSAERYATDLASSWIAAETYIKSWINISENSIKLTGSSLGILTKELSNAIGEIPKALIDTSLQLLNSILWKILINPSGWICLSVPLFIFLLYFGQIAGMIRTFKWGGKKFITILYGSFVFVYEIIKTPFGYLFRKEKVLMTTSTNDLGRQPDEDLDELTTSLSSLKIGGYKRKNRKTRKNKKYQTRKLKLKHKKRYTKHRKSNKSKKH